MSSTRPKFWAGRNNAMKIPERHYAEALAFYRDTLGLPVVKESPDGALIAFGDVRLHLDRVPLQSQTDVWLEVGTSDTAAAQRYLAEKGIAICNEVEALPKGFDGFWIAAPAGTIHLVHAAKD